MTNQINTSEKHITTEIFDINPTDKIEQNKNTKSKIEKEEVKEANDNEVISPITFAPITLDVYKSINKFSNYIEKIIQNNINKYILQEDTKKPELKTFSKLADKEFKIPDLFFKFLTPSIEDINIIYKDVLFFDINPIYVAISTQINSKIPFRNQTNTLNFIFLFNIFSNQVEKIFYSFDEITSINVIGINETILVTSRKDGYIDFIDILRPNKLYNNLHDDLNITVNLETTNEFNDIEIYLPSYSFKAHDFNIIKLRINSFNTNIDTTFNIYSIDSEANIKIYNLQPKLLEQIFKEENKELNHEIYLSLSNIKAWPTNQIIKDFHVIALSYSKAKIYALTSTNFIQITIENSSNIKFNLIHDNSTESNKLTCFTISDNGYIIACYSDLSIKIINEQDLSTIFTASAPVASFDTIINAVYWSNVICKNENNILIRKDLLTNFFVLTNKNDFIHFDLNQKNIQDIKVIYILNKLENEE